MSKAKLLEENEIVGFLEENPQWTRNQNKINRELIASNFTAAVGILNAIAILAEKKDHHPDILIYGWNKVRITLTTHESGGLTNLDLELAKEIDELNF